MLDSKTCGRTFNRWRAAPSTAKRRGAKTLSTLLALAFLLLAILIGLLILG